MPSALPKTINRAELDAELGRRSLSEFIRQAWHLVEPDAELSWNWHLDLLCSELEAVTAGESHRLIVNVPPGTMKSLMVSVFWPAWEWTRDAGLRYLCASYGAHLAIRDNRRLRAIVTSPWYRRAFGVELASDQAAKVRFDTTEQGWRIATSIGGVGTGEHPDRIIIDDPHSAEQARSAAERETACYWFDKTISTRKARGPATVIIMQRLHEDDLSGHLLARGGWRHLCLPMRYETAPEGEELPYSLDPRDPRTTPGELLWPEHWSEGKVRELELDLGPYGAAGQLQQRPAPEGGGLFQRDWFRIVDISPVEARRCRGWDTGGTEGGGDWTVGVKMAMTTDGIFYVEDVARGQLGPGGVDSLIEQTAGADGVKCSIREEQEPGSAGKSVIAARTKSLAGYDYSGVPATGDKVTRARPFRAQCEAGNVRLVRGPWNEDYLRELSVFPAGSHDDQVDGSSCAFNELALQRVPDTRTTWGSGSR